jgi:hypothetical protein
VGRLVKAGIETWLTGKPVTDWFYIKPVLYPVPRVLSNGQQRLWEFLIQPSLPIYDLLIQADRYMTRIDFLDIHFPADENGDGP